MKTAQQGRGEQAPAEQTEAPVGPGLASLLWAKPDTRASFRWLRDTHTHTGHSCVSGIQAGWCCVFVGTRVCTVAPTTRCGVRYMLCLGAGGERGGGAPVLAQGQVKNTRQQGSVNWSLLAKSSPGQLLHSS